MNQTHVRLEEVRKHMAARDHSDLLNEEARRNVLLALADDVPGLVKEVERLEHIISEKPDCNTLVDPYFQRFWEACIGLSEKADFKFILGHVKRLEDELKEARATK